MSGSSTAAYTETFAYDGFGNLTGKTLNGTLNAIGVDPTTNRLTSAVYDGNGNMTSGAGGSFSYDGANRMASAVEAGGGAEYYSYAPDGKRIYRMTVNGGSMTEEWTFWGAKGEKLAKTTGSPTGWGAQSIWFAGRLIWENGTAVFQDRLGTNRGGVDRFYPYGEEITATGNDREKFATYNRDSYTGLDYADRRFYASTYGRFNSPDPYQASGGPSDPGSWNRYSYAGGDPINRSDPRGLLWCDAVCDDGGSGDDSGWGYWNPVDPCVMLGNCRGGSPDPPPGPAQPPTAPSKPTPTCSISLYERPVDVPGVSAVAEHTYLYVQDASGSETVEAGPDFVSLPAGYLVGTVSSPPGKGLGNGPNATNPSLSSNTQVGSAYTGSSACTDAQEIDAIVSKYDSGGSWAKYNPVPALGPGYNSNSFTFTLLGDVGLSGYFGSPGFAPGWGYVVPGLHQ